jgi:hypothetical protein
LDVRRGAQPGQRLDWLVGEEADARESLSGHSLYQVCFEDAISNDEKQEIRVLVENCRSIEQCVQVVSEPNVAGVAYHEAINQTMSLAEVVVAWQWSDEVDINEIRNNRDVVSGYTTL